MIQGPDFVYVHFPKSGGSSIRGILREFFSFELDRTHTHMPVSYVRDLIGARRTLGSIRQAVSWYESRMNYPSFRGRPLPFKGDHNLDFIGMSEFIRCMSDRKFLTDNEEVRWREGDLDIRPFSIMKRKGIGFLTFEFLYTYCCDLSMLVNDSAYLEIDFDHDLAVDQFIVTEDITGSFQQLLAKYEVSGQQVPEDQLLGQIHAYRKVNSRPRDLVKTMSTEEVETIHALDGRVIAFHARLADALREGSNHHG